MKRTALARKSPLHRTAWPRRVKRDPALAKAGPSRAAKPISRSMRLLIWDRSGGTCEFCLAATAVHIHHRKLRSQGGQHTAANLIHLCRGCHDWAHACPRLAVEFGLIVKATSDPAAVRVIPIPVVTR